MSEWPLFHYETSVALNPFVSLDPACCGCLKCVEIAATIVARPPHCRALVVDAEWPLGRCWHGISEALLAWHLRGAVGTASQMRCWHGQLRCAVGTANSEALLAWHLRGAVGMASQMRC